jgi:CHAT domain-containing protein/tetratricopeptide (TPR) repeat protein
VNAEPTSNANARVDWNTLYSEARQKVNIHDPRAAALVERGLAGTVENPGLNYQFRLLKAQVLASMDPDQSLKIVQTPPPANLSCDECAARKNYLEGWAYGALDKLEKARLSLDAAERLAKQNKPEMLPEIQFRRGVIARKHDHLQDAQQYFQEAISLARRYRESWLEADALNSLGYIQMQAERYDEAIDWFSAALKSAQAAGAEVAHEQALGNLGWSRYQLGDFTQSIPLLTEGERIAASQQQFKDQFLWLNDLGDVYLDEDDYEKAESYYLKVKALAQANGDKQSLLSAIHNLAQLELKRNNLQKAEQYDRESSAILNEKDILRQISDPDLPRFCRVTTAEIAMRTGRLSDAEIMLKSIAHGPGGSSLHWRAERDLANVYEAEHKDSLTQQEFEHVVKVVETARSKILTEDKRITVLDGGPYFDDYIHFLFNHNQAAKALQITERGRARTLAEGLKVRAASRPTAAQITVVQHSLHKDDVILNYWLTEKESYLWVITQSGVTPFNLGPRQEIEPVVQAYSNEILQHQNIEESRNGKKLYQLLIQPAEKLIPQQAHVTVIPYGALYKLNFETLIVPGSKPHYWIEDVMIDEAISIVLLANSRHAPSRTPKQLLVMGNPVEASSDYPALHHAGEEIERIEKYVLASQEKVIQGKDATPEAYASAHPGDFDWIHLTTHGTSNPVSPLDSAIILSPGKDNSFRLYARDIMKIQIHADLVTISACYSAGSSSNYSGEGLVGLAWAFLRAGAHGVVAGLWEVDDRSMPDFMDDFYSKLKGAKDADDVAKALRSAKLNMVHAQGARRLPYYWASLVLYSGS